MVYMTNKIKNNVLSCIHIIKSIYQNKTIQYHLKTPLKLIFNTKLTDRQTKIIYNHKQTIKTLLSIQI